ncbi:hypothetical protein [Paludibaculum fermentans]|uniref:hypothetical protein n=1 Tax=Paludibaculum fermentans TaxID=1473598 RepID=UPI003EBBA7D3
MYVSQLQINFQIPWRTLRLGRIRVEVEHGVFGLAGAIEAVVVSPAIFASPLGVAFMVCSAGVPAPGATCSVWGNGFGPTDPPQVDGAPTRPEVLASTESRCAVVTFCGLAPATLMYELDFVFLDVGRAPSGNWCAVLNSAGTSVEFVLPSI